MARTRTVPQSEIVAEIFDYITSFIERRRIPPTRREIMQACCISSTSMVSYYLLELKRQGKIDWTPGSARSIVLTNQAPA